MKLRGFTLIELLVVIAIIALLSAVVLSSLDSARAKGNDATRISDVHAVTDALALYYGKHGYYPPITDNNCAGNGWNELGPALLSDGDMSTLPKDPGSYALGYCSDLNSNAQEYVVWAQMQNTTDVPRTSYKGTFFTHWGGDDINCGITGFYCVAYCEINNNDYTSANPALSVANCGTY